MNYRTTLLFAAALACFLAAPATFAQAPAIGKRQRAPVLSRHEVVELELEMAQTQYSAEPGPAARGNLVAAYEKMIGLVCMPKLLKDLSYAGNPADPKCRTLIEKTLELYPMDPVALCARDGIRSRSCQEAFANQQFAVFSRSGRDAIPDLDLKLDSARAASEENRRLNSEYVAAKYAYQRSRKPEDRTKVLELSRQLLREYCRVTRVVFSADLPTPTPAPLSDIFGGGRHAPPPTPAAGAEQPMTRTIQVSPECHRYVTEALEVDPFMPAAVCVKFGNYSPDCVDAHRRWRARQTPAKNSRGTTRQGEEAFETF